MSIQQTAADTSSSIETNSHTESQTVSETESHTEFHTESQTESETESESESETESELLNYGKKISRAKQKILQTSRENQKIWTISEAYRVANIEPTEFLCADRKELAKFVQKRMDELKNSGKLSEEKINQAQTAAQEAENEKEKMKHIKSIIDSTKGELHRSVKIRNVNDIIEEIQYGITQTVNIIQNMEASVRRDEKKLQKKIEDEGIQKAKIEVWKVKFDIRKIETDFCEPVRNPLEEDEILWNKKEMIRNAWQSVYKTQAYLNSIEYLPTEQIAYPETAKPKKQGHYLRNERLIYSTWEKVHKAFNELEESSIEFFVAKNRFLKEPANGWLADNNLNKSTIEIVEIVLVETNHEINSRQRAILTAEDEFQDTSLDITDFIEVRKPEEEISDAKAVLREVEEELKNAKQVNDELSNKVRRAVEEATDYIETAKKKLNDPLVKIRIANEEVNKAEEYYQRAVQKFYELKKHAGNETTNEDVHKLKNIKNDILSALKLIGRTELKFLEGSSNIQEQFASTRPEKLPTARGRTAKFASGSPSIRIIENNYGKK